MRDNQTTRRMPMIVTAMVCATASMLAGLALAPSAMAAGTIITDQDKVDAGQREHAARRRPVPDPAQRQVDEARPEPQSDPTRPPGGGELSCKPYLGPILHTIGTAVFIHGTSPKGTERR